MSARGRPRSWGRGRDSLKSQQRHSQEDEDLTLLLNFAKVRYRKEMEALTASPSHIEINELKAHHTKTLLTTLEIVSETKPLTSEQKLVVHQTLDQMFTSFQEINMKKLSSESSPAIGIDLGTTYCCLAVCRQNHKVEIIPNDMGNNKTPSYIAFPNENTQEDPDNDDDDDDDDKNEPFYGEAAKMLAHDNPNFTIFDVKRMLGRHFYDPQLQRDMKFWPFNVISTGTSGEIQVQTGPDSQHSPLQLIILFLKHLKELAENFIGSAVYSAVVTVPAYFNDKQRKLTIEACNSAGLNVLQLINEPTAAAVAYKIHLKSNEVLHSRKYLIFDFGGGTFDVSVLTMNASQIHVLAVGGDAHLGGEDIDNNMVEYCILQFKNQQGVDLNMEKMSLDPKAALMVAKRLRRLKLECEKQKLFLSQVQNVMISLDAMHGSIPLIVPVSRDTFNSINKEIFEKCIREVDQVLRNAEVDRSEIDDVVLVGGSSRIPRVQEMLSEYFGGKLLCRSIDADEAVAVGAAMLAFHAEHVELPNVLIQEVEVTASPTVPDGHDGTMRSFRQHAVRGIFPPWLMSRFGWRGNNLH